MKRILVLQNHRIGDTLQTTPLLAGLRRKHPPCHITLVTNAMFAGLNLGGLADETIHFDQNELFRCFSDPRLSLVGKFNRARAFLEPFRRRRFDLVVDIPADPHMHLLASSLENAGEIRGAILSPARTLRYSHREVMLLYTIGLCRPVNRFNLVDLYGLVAGLLPERGALALPVNEDDTASACRMLAQAGVDPDAEFTIGCQAGASDDRKRWHETGFAEVARKAADRFGARTLLFGAEAERATVERVAAQAGPGAVPLAGRTTLGELAALVRLCRVLVTNDTGTMHVAAAVGTPVVSLSVGPVCFRETGPYAEGSYVLEPEIECSPCNFNASCNHFSCRERITPDMVLALVAAVCTPGNPDGKLEAAVFRGARLHRAAFNDVARMEFVPVFRYPADAATLMSWLYAHVWECFYGMRTRGWAARELLERIEACHEVSSWWPHIAGDIQGVLADLEHIEGKLDAALRPFESLRTCAAGRDWIDPIEAFQSAYQELLQFGRPRPLVRHFTALLELGVESQAGAEPARALSEIASHGRFVFAQIRFLHARLAEIAASCGSPSVRAARGEPAWSPVPAAG